MALPDVQPLPVDGQGNVLKDGVWSPYICEKLITFTGGTANTWGDYDGTADGGAVFLVTGTVRARIFGVVETSVVGAGTIELGITGATAVLIAQVADAEDLDVGEIWHDATVDAKVELATIATDKIIAGGTDPILTIGTANLTAGAVRFVCSWFPISADGNVMASNT